VTLDEAKNAKRNENNILILSLKCIPVLGKVLFKVPLPLLFMHFKIQI